MLKLKIFLFLYFFLYFLSLSTLINSNNIKNNSNSFFITSTFFLGSPKWFQNRFSLLLSNILSNLILYNENKNNERNNERNTYKKKSNYDKNNDKNDNDSKNKESNNDSYNDNESESENDKNTLKIQIFYNKYNKMSLNSLKYNYIQKLIKNNIIILTSIPKEYKHLKKKDILKLPWFWKSLKGEKVLLFGGNTVLCSNSPYTIDNFINYDYIGTQWNLFNGKGGSGELSLRDRKAVLKYIEENGNEDYYKLHPESEDQLLVQGLQNVAPKEISLQFAISSTRGSLEPFGISGVLPGMNTTLRSYYIEYCPELKMLFPVLHSPECFGQAPKPLYCFKFLCQNGLHCRESDQINFQQQYRNGDVHNISLQLDSIKNK